ncbi:hypothetical protein TRIUR3_25095 [Triticum urartu]|uniref:Uncharacterized protein n=1 Tax=Triticum urartu TaxID=4572 RepID=M8A9I4_TRIUA|nr:hypothetical protein TRIUR3_25095 [Triticum urartu]
MLLPRLRWSPTVVTSPLLLLTDLERIDPPPRNVAIGIYGAKGEKKVASRAARCGSFVGDGADGERRAVLRRPRPTDDASVDSRFDADRSTRSSRRNVSRIHRHMLGNVRHIHVLYNLLPEEDTTLEEIVKIPLG